MGERVLAVDDNAVNLKIVSATLASGGYIPYIATSGPEAINIAEQVAPDLIILDINMPDMDGYEVCRLLRSKPGTANVPIMMLTANDTLEEKIKGFESGADDYLTKPFQPAELNARVKGLLRRTILTTPVSSISDCKVISIFSLRGGIGVSTIAANLAVGLSQIWGKRVALIDLNLVMGQCALMLNLPLKKTWSDLAIIHTDDYQPEIFQSILLQHDSGVSVLAAPRNSFDGELVTQLAVQKVLDQLRKMFSYVVIDLPHDFSETTLAGLDASDEIVFVMAPELASIRATVGAFEVFEKLGYIQKKHKIILNWIFEKRGLARKDMEKVIKKSIDIIVPFAPESTVSGINLGNPIVISAPASPMGILFEDLSFSLSKDKDRENKPENITDAWKRTHDRASKR
jgi:pilus assembly protein CpaE